MNQGQKKLFEERKERIIAKKGPAYWEKLTYRNKHKYGHVHLEEPPKREHSTDEK